MNYPIFVLKKKEEPRSETIILNPEKMILPNWSEEHIWNKDSEIMLEKRCSGELKGHTWLNPMFDWVIVQDGIDLVLIATRKVQ